MKILIVDNTPISLHILDKIITDEGAITVKATDGSEAVELFKKSKSGEFDMIVTDINMPGMNGYEEAKTIRSLWRRDARKIPIIAVTADESLSVEEKCEISGINQCIKKTYIDDELPVLIQKVKNKK